MFKYLNLLSGLLLWPLAFAGKRLNKMAEKFMIGRSGPFAEGVTLDSSKVYILPTRLGMIYTLLLLFLLLGAINYTKSLAFMLTFLLASLGMVAMLTTWRNLAGLKLKKLGASPVFAEQQARFAVQMENYGRTTRYAIAIEHDGEQGEVVDVSQNGLSLIHFNQRTTQRGYLDPKRFKLSTEFPLGLFVAWTWVDLAMSCLVYPKPSEQAPDFKPADREQGDEAGEGQGMEDFAGLRKFNAGDSWRHISWKAAARSDELYSKEFIGSHPRYQWIDWYALKEPQLEKRLSQMTRLILDAQAAGRDYGIKFPGTEIKPGNGVTHRHACLRALAVYQPNSTAS